MAEFNNPLARIPNSPSALVDGGALDPKITLPKTLLQVLQRTVQNHATHGLIYLQADGSEITQSYPALFADACRIAGGLRQKGVLPGGQVLIQLDLGQDFFPTLWGCLIGGYVPVPVSIPKSYEATHPDIVRLRHAWETLHRPLIVSTTKQIPSLVSATQKGDWASSLNIISADDLRKADPLSPTLTAQPEDLAVMMLTSGSTGAPKLVMLSHQNVIHFCAGIQAKNQLTADDLAFNWMPLEHAGSLLMIHFASLFCGAPQIHSINTYILADPLRWLDVMNHHKVRITWAPNFAYALVNQRSEEIATRRWDLSNLRLVINGGEAVVASTVRRFCKLLEPHGLRSSAVTSAWGMSETSSGVAFSAFSLQTMSDLDPYVEVGSPLPGLSFRIVDKDNRLLKEGAAGQLQVRGTMVTRGYFENEAANKASFTPDGWFNTGDLALIRAGKLTITGREKDILIINGAHRHPHEIESAVEEIPGIVTSFTAACSVRVDKAETDQLAIFFHTGMTGPDLYTLLQTIRSLITKRFGTTPDFLIPVQPTAIPKTEIGKIRHGDLKKRFEANEFADIVQLISLSLNTQPTAVEKAAKINEPQTLLQKQIASIWRTVLKLGEKPLGIDDDFFDLGGHSLLALQVIGRLQSDLKISLPPQLLQNVSTIARLAAAIEALQSAPADAGPSPKIEMTASMYGGHSIPENLQPTAFGGRRALNYAERWMVDGLAVADIPGSFTVIELDMSAALRYLKPLQKKNIFINETSFLVHAIAKTFQRLPHLRMVLSGYDCYYPSHVDVGLSVAGESFVAPTIILKAAETKSLEALAQEIEKQIPVVQKRDRIVRERLSRWGRLVPFGFLRRALFHLLAKRIQPRMTSAGTVQVTALPALDIIVPLRIGTSIAMGIGGIRERVVLRQGNMEVRQVLQLSCAFDHAVWDGMCAATFMSELKTIVENFTYQEIS